MTAPLHQRRRVAVDPVLTGRMMLRRLLAENAQLLQEVAELRALRDQAFTDGLTGLPNRRYLEARLGEELSRARRGRAQQGALLVVDVERFRFINERHGCAVGDRALRWLTRLLLDTVGARDVACRTGGNELMVIMPDAGRDAAEDLQARFEARVKAASGHRWLPMAVASGVAVWPESGRALQDLLDAAANELGESRRSRLPPIRLQLVR